MLESTFAVQPIYIASTIALVVFILSLLAARVVQNRGAIRRRITTSGGIETHGRSSLISGSESKALSFLARVGALLEDTSAGTSDLRNDLIKAGFFSPSAVVTYQSVRLITAIATALLIPFIEAAFGLDMLGSYLPLVAAVSGGIGFLLPSVWLDWRKKDMRSRYRNAFPDFMDLVVVCIESGQSLQGALDRVSHEIVQFSPHLGANLHVVTLELRAGRTLVDALRALSARVDIEEVRSLTVLLKQSEELGASISATLRVFSEEMRDKRLMRAEAKAHALPVKMTIPLGLFMFPVILMVILVPVVIRFLTVPF